MRIKLHGPGKQLADDSLFLYYSEELVSPGVTPFGCSASSFICMF